MNTYRDDLVLYHSGAKGQKWGRRRYRNYDGTLTPAGRERYGVGPAREKAPNERKSLRQRYSDYKEAKRTSIRSERKEATKAAEEARKATEELRKEREALETARDEATQKQRLQDRNDIMRLDNQELSARIERMKLEREYAKLVNPPAPERESLIRKLGGFARDAKPVIELGSSVYKLYSDVKKGGSSDSDNNKKK